MKRTLTAFFIVFCAYSSYGQGDNGVVPDSVAYGMTLKEVDVTAPWANDTDRYHYNQMKHYVKIVLPYVNTATKLFKDIDAKVNEPNITRKERRQYVNAKEDEMRTQFEEKVRRLNTTQGVLLVKLISRQTNTNLYKVLQEFKNPLTAVKWQMWARMNGLNLDRRYDPEEESRLERIMDELGYPLPAGYVSNIIR
jgi:hypothetical protein